MDGILRFGDCLAWNPVLVSLHVVSDILLFLAYTAIPIAVLIYASQKKDYRIACYCVAGFIFWYSLIHVAQAVNMWYPIPLILGSMKAVTAILAVIAAIAVFPLLARALELKTPKEYSEYAAAVQHDLHIMKGELDAMTSRVGLLIDELSTRTQNVLANVQAIAKETAKTSETVPLLLAKLNSRIGGMARCQEILNFNGRKGAHLKQLIEAQLDAFPALKSIVEIEGQDIAVNADAAEQIAAAVHELAANTCKHKDVKDGITLKVSWKPGATGNRAIIFNWHEERKANGVDSVIAQLTDRASAHKGFGRTVLEYIVPTQMRGFSDLAFGPNGEVNYELEAPWAEVKVAA